MDFNNKKIGIWGYGVVGKSVINFLDKINIENNLNIKLSVFDYKNIKKVNNLNVKIFKDLEAFLDENNIIIPSPGIDLRNFLNKYKHKFLAELDLFSFYFNQPVIAITGTLGKTTVVTVLNDLLKKLNYKVSLAGNIGVGACDLILDQDKLDFAILELSSFQLEWAKSFKAKYSLVTNFSANHLDRHNNINNYFNSKLNIFNNSSINLVDKTFLDFYNLLIKDSENKYKFNLFDKSLNKDLSENKNINYNFCIKDNFIVYLDNISNKITNIININYLNKKILIENWLVIIGFLYLLDKNIDFISLLNKYNFAGIEHRLELFSKKNDLEFYNDSKSTVPGATLAALDSLAKINNKNNIILIIGGLSKGVSRDSFIKKLSLNKNIKIIICFGLEGKILKDLCVKYKLKFLIFNDLKNSVKNVFEIANKGDKVLFSPSGSSFDLFKNYEERGRIFKDLVNNYNIDSF